MVRTFSIWLLILSHPCILGTEYPNKANKVCPVSVHCSFDKSETERGAFSDDHGNILSKGYYSFSKWDTFLNPIYHALA